MKLFTLCTISLAAALVEGYIVPPPGPVLPETISDCSGWVLPTSSDTCATIAPKNGITVAQFITYNPLVGSACTLTIGFAYCIQENGGKPPGTTLTAKASTSKSTTKAQTTASTTSAGNGIATPTPIQAGMVSNCNSFYLVQTGDQCGTIATAKGISLTDFYTWNPAVGSSCASLWANTYVCIGVIGSKPTPPPHTTTSAGNGIATPTPIQAGMTSNCNAFYLVEAGDQCGTIATAKGISLADFYAWNPAVGSSCASLWGQYYVCVGVVGSKPTPPTPTSSGNGIATPTPIQAGMTGSCRKFHLVVSGDQCGNIATAAGIALSNFYSWNPTVGSSCGSLWLGYYVCIGV